MAIDRYEGAPLILGGSAIGTSLACVRIYNAASRGDISTSVVILKEATRLDQLAGKNLGDARLWWAIAAASGVGWALQCPPGTRLLIPTNVSELEALL